MDEQLRERMREIDLGDPEAVVAVLSAWLRSGGRPVGQRGKEVGGVVLARVLRYLLEASGQREVEVLRASEVEAKHHERWIRALRDLMNEERVRTWVWVERWADLLGFDRDLLGLAAEVQPSLRASLERGSLAGGGWWVDRIECRRCRHHAQTRQGTYYCDEPRRRDLPQAQRWVLPTDRCDHFERET